MTIRRRFFPGKRTNIEPARSIDMGITLTPLTDPAKPCPPARVLDAEGNLLAELGCDEAYTVPPYPPTPCPCAPAAVGWLIQPTPGQTYQLQDDPYNADSVHERHPWIQPQLVDAYIEDADGNRDTSEDGRIAILRLNSLPMWGDLVPQDPPPEPPNYPNPHQSWLFLAAPFGDAHGIRWDYDWDISSDLPHEPDDVNCPDCHNWWAGHETEQIGQFLHVRIKHGYLNPYPWLPGSWRAYLTATAYCGDNQVGQLVLRIDATKLA